MIIDAHHHLWDPSRRHYPWMSGAAMDPIRRPYTVDDLRAAAGPTISATILVQTVSSMDETEEFLRVAEHSNGLIAGVIGWLDLTTTPDIPTHPLLVGIRHQVEDEPDPDFLLRPNVQRTLRAIGEAGLPYDLLVRAPQRQAALTAARLLPNVHFVLDHAGKPDIAAAEWHPWSTWLTALAALPNVTCKLSGLLTQAPHPAQIRPYATHILSTFGPTRTMFGSDWPVSELAAPYPKVLTLTQDLLTEASPAERSAILSDTARRTYQLDRGR